MQILRATDRVKVKIQDVEFHIAPLTREAKRQLAACRFIESGEEKLDLLEANTILLKYGLKNVIGLQDYHGDDYQLEFDGDVLSDQCVTEVLSLDCKEKLTASGWSIVNGGWQSFDLDGVELGVIKQGEPDS